MQDPLPSVKAMPGIFLLCAAIILAANSQSLAFADGAKSLSEKDATELLLDDLNAQLERVEKLQEAAPTQEEGDAAKARFAALKERQKDLRKKFSQSKYEALRADIGAESARLSKYLAKSSGAANDLPEVQPNDAASRVPPHLMPSAAISQSQNVQIHDLIASLETEINELERRVNLMPTGSERDAAKKRVHALQDRSLDLANNFDKERYNNLRSDVKSEWDTVTR